MIKLNKCCNTNTFTKVKEVYRSNVDEFILYQCTKCEKFWLYRKLEFNYVDNLRFDLNEYEAWYIGVDQKDLEKVYALEFDKILLTHGYLHLSTVDENRDWQRIRE